MRTMTYGESGAKKNLKFTGIDMSAERRIISLSRSPQRSPMAGVAFAYAAYHRHISFIFVWATHTHTHMLRAVCIRHDHIRGCDRCEMGNDFWETAKKWEFCSIVAARDFGI